MKIQGNKCLYFFYLSCYLPVWHCYLGSILASKIEIQVSCNLWTKPLNQLRLIYEQFIYVLYLDLVVYVSFVMNKFWLIDWLIDWFEISRLAVAWKYHINEAAFQSGLKFQAGLSSLKSALGSLKRVFQGHWKSKTIWCYNKRFAIWEDWIVSKSIWNSFAESTRGEIADCWRDKNAPCEKFPNKTRDYIDKFEGFTNNQIKHFIFTLLTVTGDLDYPLEVLLLEVIFLIRDLFSITSEETKQYMLDGDIAYDRRTASNFPGKGW